jgi:hypothetical protein
MSQPLLHFMDYFFTLCSSGDIIMDRELDPTHLNVKTGDKFEVVIVPDIGIVFKKIK